MIDTGDTAWILTSTALVLFMTIPGLSLFYGGLVRTKNVLSVLMQCFVLTAFVTVLWFAYGYSLAFDTTGMEAGTTGLHSFVGGLGKTFLRGITPETASGTIPEILFVAFQLTFAIITPALIVGAFAERMRFSAMMLFMIGWLTLVYLPICHMTWGGDGSFFGDMGVFDFAGGIVVHITAGVAALVLAIQLGVRKGWPTTPMPPHNLTMTVTGTGMLWVGWFGFNAGSALGANGSAAMALMVTQISAATAALTWMFIEWGQAGRPSVLGIVTGSIAGLAAVTPASGFIGPFGGFAIGLASGCACYWASVVLKFRLGYDDSLDVFGVHGVGGFVG
ncbi:MAG: ammonium transporter, partial [Myxococcota bacterium]